MGDVFTMKNENEFDSQSNKLSDEDLGDIAGGHVISGEENVNVVIKSLKHHCDPMFFEMIRDALEEESKEEYEKAKNKWYIIDDLTGKKLGNDEGYVTKEEAIAVDKILNKNSSDKKWYSLRKTRVLSADDYIKKYGYSDVLL